MKQHKATQFPWNISAGDLSTEDLYQMFKQRLIEELRVDLKRVLHGATSRHHQRKKRGMSMSVKRYDFGPVQPEHYERDGGDFVHYENYAALQIVARHYKGEICELKAELRRMTKNRDDWRDMAQRKESSVPD